jgi:hypothetical protein
MGLKKLGCDVPNGTTKDKFALMTFKAITSKKPLYSKKILQLMMNYVN